MVSHVGTPGQVVVQNIRTTSDPPFLSIRSGSVVALVNGGDCSVSCRSVGPIPFGLVGGLEVAAYNHAKVKVQLYGLCVGFGRGKFREIKPEDGDENAFNPEKEVAYDLKDSDDLVMLENKVLSVADVVKTRAEASGQAAVAYYSMVKKPGEDGFVLKQDCF